MRTLKLRHFYLRREILFVFDDLLWGGSVHTLQDQKSCYRLGRKVDAISFGLMNDN
jgi:hypothetical protein